MMSQKEYGAREIRPVLLHDAATKWCTPSRKRAAVKPARLNLANGKRFEGEGEKVEMGEIAHYANRALSAALQDVPVPSTSQCTLELDYRLILHLSKPRHAVHSFYWNI